MKCKPCKYSIRKIYGLKGYGGPTEPHLKDEVEIKGKKIIKQKTLLEICQEKY